MANIKAYYAKKQDVEETLKPLPFETQVEEWGEGTLFVDFPSGTYQDVVRALDNANIEHE